MSNKIKNILNNPYFVISIVFFLSQMFIIVLSGCWWDDWTFMTHNLSYVHDVASGSGRPEWNLLIPLCWSLPNNGRILIFILYYLISIFVYNTLSNTELFNRKDNILITLLFIITPVNDARVLISNFPYTVGLFLFYLGMMLFVKWNKTGKKIIYRITILLVFFSSFILNSLLVYYYLIFAYLLALEINNCVRKLNIKDIFLLIKRIIIKYLDFFLLPIVYFVVNKIAFPVTDVQYEARSSITLLGLLKTVKYLPLSIINIFKECVINIFSTLEYWPIAVCALIMVVTIIIKNNNNNQRSKKKVIKYLIYGLVTLILSLFVYVEVRTSIISSNGVGGRDTILVPLGIAITSFAVLSLLKNKYKNALCIITIFLGIISFNKLYIEWQKDYYYQLSIENLMNNEIIKRNDTFYFADINETKIKGQRFYSLNSNAYCVFNNQTRIFIPLATNIGLLEDKEKMDYMKNDLNGAYMMRDYCPEDYNLDAIIIYSCDLSTKEVLILKYYELFNKEEFNKLIKEIGEMKVIEVDDNFTKRLLDKFNEGFIKNDNDVINLLMNYN